MSKFNDGRVHFRNLGMEVLNTENLSEKKKPNNEDTYIPICLTIHYGEIGDIHYIDLLPLSSLNY